MYYKNYNFRTIKNVCYKMTNTHKKFEVANCKTYNARDKKFEN